MSLLKHATEALDLDAPTASKALGAVFTSIRMGVNTKSFSKVTAAFPDSTDWMRDAPTTTAQTGAMIALATPATLERGLGQLGLTADHIATLGKLVGAALRDGLPADVYTAIATKLPFLAG